MTQDGFNNWLENIIKIESPSPDIIAYYFGIIETSEGFETYLVGSTEFEKNDSDWACNNDFTPKNRYFKLGQKNTDWRIIINQVKTLIENFSRTKTFENSFFNKAQAIAAGFDEGEIFQIK